MVYKFYYIDDDPIENINGIARNLSIHKDLLEVIPFQHGLWNDVKSHLLKNQEELSGLLLDWKLKNRNKDGVIADFNAAALAQQLRVLSVDKKELKKDFPIVLVSAEVNFYEVYNKEKTIHDLFDLIYSKDDLADCYEDVIKQLSSLANAYILVYSSSRIEDLGIDDSRYDARFIEGLNALFSDGKIAHLVIKYLLNNFILNNGILIDEYVLAARLGVDIKSSASVDWKKLKFDVLGPIKYNGILSDGWDRWNQIELIEFWSKLFNVSLASLSASERVDCLNTVFELKLTPAIPLKYNYNTKFWFVCDNSKCPIAYDEAILKKKPENVVPWLDNKYLSYEEAFNHDLNKDIDLIDRERVVFLKKKFSNENSRNQT